MMKARNCSLMLPADSALRVAYLSVNRGEGGQNGIGPELGELLGIVRTEELLAARKLDGAEQYFTRAYDFGFTRSVEETFAKWNKEEVLSDMVRVIRTMSDGGRQWLQWHCSGWSRSTSGRRNAHA